MKPPKSYDSSDYIAEVRPPDPHEPIEERAIRLERLVEVLRQELINQNQRMLRLEAAMFPGEPPLTEYR